MDHHLVITCGCGASLDVYTTFDMTCESIVKEFLKVHNHCVVKETQCKKK